MNARIRFPSRFTRHVSRRSCQFAPVVVLLTHHAPKVSYYSNNSTHYNSSIKKGPLGWPTRRVRSIRACVSSQQQTPGVTPLTQIQADAAILESCDDSNEEGVRSKELLPLRKTKLICTIGPSCSDPQTLEKLAARGMNVARLNMSHGSHEWHKQAIDTIRKLNKELGYSVAIMVDTEGGSEVHLVGLPELAKVHEGEQVLLTIRHITSNESASPMTMQVSFEGFSRDCRPGDIIMIDGGMATLRVDTVSGPDILCQVVDPGIVLPRASVTIRRDGVLVKSTDAFMPTICAKDWEDIDMAIEQQIDFIAVSFVRTADVLDNLRSYIARKTDRSIHIVAKIEAWESLDNLDSIIAASDVVMIARGDLGAQISITEVPKVQKRIVDACKSAGKAVIVASQLLESMHTLPTPTRAEVADIFEAVRQEADAIMLSGETAIGLYPLRTLEVLRDVAQHAEVRLQQTLLVDRNASRRIRADALSRSSDVITQNICAAASMLADNLKAKAIFSFTESGSTAFALSQMRPSASIFAFTDSSDIRLQCSMWWGIIPFRLDFSTDFETNIRRTIQYCKHQRLCNSGDVIVVVSHIQSHEQSSIHSHDVAAEQEGEHAVLGNSVQVRVVE